MRFLGLDIRRAGAEPEPQFQAKAIDENSPGWLTLMGGFGSARMDWTDAEKLWKSLSDVELEAAYGSHPLVRSCVALLTRTACEPRLAIGYEDAEGFKEVKNNPILDLVMNPNDDYSYNTFMEYWLTRWLVTGRGHVWKVRGWKNGGKISQLWPLPTSWVTPIQANEGMILLRGYNIANMPTVQATQDILTAWFGDPSDMIRSLSPLHSASRALQIDYERENYLMEMLCNLKVPGLVVKHPRGLTPDKRKEILTELDNRAGKGRRGGPVFVEGGGDKGDYGIDMLNPLADLDWPGLSAMSEARICQVYGTPPIMVGARLGIEKSTYSNYGEARGSFYTSTMRGVWTALSSFLTLSLLRQEGEKKLVFKYQYEELPEFQEDESSKSTRIVEQFKAKLIGKREARQQLGYNPDPPKNDEWFEETAEPNPGQEPPTEPEPPVLEPDPEDEEED